MRNKYILLLILALAFILRTYRLGEYPALNADEAAIGYNAYSLLETGRDEHGNPWPVHFQSFNDYKPGGYVYMVLPFVKLFGLNEWSVRVPGALLGVGTVLLIYLLVLELGRLREFSTSTKIKTLALVSAVFLALSPWHIHFSRGGWEVNVATFFITLGVLSFLRANRKEVLSIKYLIFCIVSFVLSLYTYHSARIVVPLLIFGLLLVYKDRLRSNLSKFVVVGMFGLFLLIPLTSDLIGGQVLTRASGVGIFADQGTIERINEQRGEHLYLNGIIPRVLHNKVVNYSLAFVENWSEHFHGEFLFLTGDKIQRNKVPETGQMYLLDIVFLGVGIVLLIKAFRGDGKKVVFMTVWWVIIAPVAAALTFQSPHALRAHNMVIPLTIISSLGAYRVINWLKSETRYWRIGLSIIILLFTWQFIRYQLMYWKHMAREYPFSSQYGLKELVQYVSEEEHKFEKVIVTDHYDQPYILFLFYLKYPPERFQNEHLLSDPDNYGFSTVRSFANFEFRAIDFEKDRYSGKKSLIIGTKDEVPEDVNLLTKIYGVNGYNYFRIYKN